MKAFEY